jgi:hypothetical protein
MSEENQTPHFMHYRPPGIPVADSKQSRSLFKAGKAVAKIPVRHHPKSLTRHRGAVKRMKKTRFY